MLRVSEKVERETRPERESNGGKRQKKVPTIPPTEVLRCQHLSPVLHLAARSLNVRWREK